MVSPPSYRAAAAFVTAWLNILAYLFTLSSATIYPAQLIATVAQVYNPGYVAERWHIYLIYLLIMILSGIVVIFWSSIMPKLQSFYFFVSVLAVFAISIALLAASPTKQSAQTVLLDWTNMSGWSTGMGFMLAMGQGMWL
jgi:choline transport protein